MSYAVLPGVDIRAMPVAFLPAIKCYTFVRRVRNASLYMEIKTESRERHYPLAIIMASVDGTCANNSTTREPPLQRPPSSSSRTRPHILFFFLAALAFFFSATRRACRLAPGGAERLSLTSSGSSPSAIRRVLSRIA